MPKQSINISDFKGMSPAVSGGQSCILLSGADISTETSIIAQERADGKITVDSNVTVNALKSTIDGTDIAVKVSRNGKLLVNDQHVGAVSHPTASIDALGNSVSICSGVTSDPVSVTHRRTTANSVFENSGVIVEPDIITNSYGFAGTAKKMVVINSGDVLLVNAGSGSLTMLHADGSSHDSYPITDGEIIDIACWYGVDGHGDIAYEYCYALTIPDGSSTVVCKKFSLVDSYTGGDTANPSLFNDSYFADDGRIDDGSIALSETSVFGGHKLRTIAVSKNFLFFSIDGILDAAAMTVAEHRDITMDFLFSVDIGDWPTTGQHLASTAEDADINLWKSMLPLYYPWDGGFQYYYPAIDGTLAVLQYENDVVCVHSAGAAYINSSGATGEGVSGSYVFADKSHLLCCKGGETTPATGYNPRPLISGAHFFIEFGELDAGIAWCPILASTGALWSFVYSKKAGSHLSTIVIQNASALLDGDRYTVEHSIVGDDIFVDMGFSGLFGLVPNDLDVRQFENAIELHSYAALFFGAATIASAGVLSYEVVTTSFTDEGMVEYGSPVISLEESAMAGAITGGTYTRYRFTMTYDGVTEGPLSLQYFTAYDASDYKVTLTTSFTQAMLLALSKRITAINIYAAEADENNELSYYRKVITLQTTRTTFSYDGETFVASYVDTGARMESFEASAGYQEGLKTISVRRGCQCSYMGHMYAGDISIPADDGSRYTRNVIVKSLPLQPSGFDYARDFAIVPFTPKAIIGSSGKLYVFSEDSYCILNPSTMSIDVESTSIGVMGRKQLVDTDYGLFCFFNRNLYHVNGLTVQSIGSIVATKNNNVTKCLGDLADDAVLVYNKEKEAIMVVGSIAGVAHAFAYSLKTGKWGHYQIGSTAGGIPPEAKSEIKAEGMTFQTIQSYHYDGKQYVVAPRGATNDYDQYDMFAGNAYRDLYAVFSIDAGDSKHKAYLYDAEAQLYGKKNSFAAITVCGAIMPNNVTLYNATDNLLTVTIPESYTRKAIDNIRMTVRKLELT